MKQSYRQMDRRLFLRGAGSLIALPFLPSLLSAADPAATLPRPKRFIALGFGWGVTNETWYPAVTDTGAAYALPSGLAPLARHRQDFTLLQGLHHQHSNEAHWGSTFWLTGANRYSVSGSSFSNSISLDQVIANDIGQKTRFPSLRFNSPDVDNSGHGLGLSLSWDARGKPLAGLNSPLLAYHRLFSDENTSLAERQAQIEAQRSVLDTVLVDARRVGRDLNHEDKHKLDEYLQGVRDIEKRLERDSLWLNVAKAPPPFAAPQAGIVGKNEIELTYKLIVAALQTDSTRVVTYRQSVQELLISLGISILPHDMSHYNPGERMEASQRRDIAQSELLAGLIDQLKAVREPDGTSLFDHTCLIYGSNIRTIHYLDNCPTLIAGRGAGIKLGQHLVEAKGTPLCNAWLTLLQGLGVPAKSHGDSTGILTSLT